MTTAIRTLLTGLIDYAGLFPPAALDMARAVQEYHRYVASPDHWMLGRFVVPVARLDELATTADPLLPHDAASAWKLAALPGTDLMASGQAIGEFNCRHAGRDAGRATIDTIEFKAATPAQVAAALGAMPDWLTAYVEVPLASDMDALLDAVQAHGGRAKVRTGGVTSDAFPTGTALAQFLVACARRDLPFKATAGLHHPLRGSYRLTYEPEPPRDMMFGFLNVFLGAALARQGARAEAVATLLEESSPAAFTVTDTGIAWRGQNFSTSDLEQLRERATGFGSCSFREPTDELRTLGWL